MRFETDKMIVSLDSLCNSADPNLDMDPIDGLIRFRKPNNISSHKSNKILITNYFTML